MGGGGGESVAEIVRGRGFTLIGNCSRWFTHAFSFEIRRENLETVSGSRLISPASPLYNIIRD